MVERLSIEAIGLYQDAFSRFCSKDGSVSSSQVSGVMRQLGQNPSEAEIQDMVNQVDKDGTGMIDFPEFLSMMSLKQESEDLAWGRLAPVLSLQSDPCNYQPSSMLATISNSARFKSILTKTKLKLRHLNMFKGLK